MAKFTFLTSQDFGAPQLYGDTGSLVNLLDKCLVDGYGTTSPIGWTKPLANENSRGCWQQPSGSRAILYVNHNPLINIVTNTGGVRDAIAAGYESILNFTSSVSTWMAGGSGQFPPIAAGAYGSGSVVIRTSATNDNGNPRQWIMFVDDRTMYLFIQTGDTANTYHGFFFGDIFSIKPTSDNYKCMIHGRQLGGSSTAADLADSITNANYTTYVGMWFQRGFGGNGISVQGTKVGDAGKNTFATSTATMTGILTGPNPVDNCYYISPIWVTEPGVPTIRGRMRGMYMASHPIAGFGDGQVIYGANEYCGKVFQTVRQGYNGGMWLIEISDTLETNDY